MYLTPCANGNDSDQSAPNMRRDVVFLFAAIYLVTMKCTDEAVSSLSPSPNAHILVKRLTGSYILKGRLFMKRCYITFIEIRKCKFQIFHNCIDFSYKAIMVKQIKFG